MVASSALLIRRTAATSPWCIRIARNHGGGTVVSTELFGRSRRTLGPTATVVFPSAAASTVPISIAAAIDTGGRARSKSTLVPPRYLPPDRSLASSNKFARWDGLVNGKRPTLNHVRSFPFIGSAIPQLSGTPKINPLTNAYDFWIAMRNQFGEFYTFGDMIGNNRSDIYGTTYVINDPREAVKIIRAGGKFPSGVLEILWVNERWADKRGFHTKEGIHGRGEEWRRIRTFLQTDLLHPDSANGYLPGILRAAELASKGAGAAAVLQSSGEVKGALNSYLNRCAFDMFSSLMLGIYTETADVTTPTLPENQRFVSGAVQGLGTAIEMLFSPYENIVGKLMKFETATMRHAFEGFDAAWAVARDKIGRFIERKERGELSENERVSYLSRALDRQKEEGSNVSVREVTEIAFTGLFAAVDTTSSVLGWNLFHIARSPDVQEKLFRELLTSVGTVGRGTITAEVLSKSNAPYLHALIRETHRITPPGPLAINKTVDADGLEVNGHKMEKDQIIMLESYTVGMNPDLVERPEEFRPERWLRDAVEARKGTPGEIVDHPFLASPFSQGARKCPGSRVASNEIKAMLSQLVLDWKISSPVTEISHISYHQQAVLEVKLPNLQFEAR